MRKCDWTVLTCTCLVQMLDIIQEQELSICVQRQCARLLAMLTEIPHIQVGSL